MPATQNCFLHQSIARSSPEASRYVSARVEQISSSAPLHPAPQTRRKSNALECRVANTSPTALRQATAARQRRALVDFSIYLQ
jgi:hypothetical protein